jgi:CRISPR-associated RAMP protein (TIGR02581 family)
VTEPALLDTFKGRLRLEGLLTTRTGLHIGAGGSGDPLATDSPVVRNAAGAPFIPGASLKGVIRSAAEGLLRDTQPRQDAKEKLWTCDFLIDDPCVHHEQVKKLREDLQERLKDQVPEKKLGSEVQRATAREIWNESCTVCRLFGSLAMASRVRFPDLPLHGGVPMMEIRNGVGIDRDRELAASGVLYDFEAVPPGTEFELTVILDNYSEAEVGLVLWLFDQLDQGNLALGGKSSRGLGQVRVEWRHILETRLNGGNPFAKMLSTQDLLQPDRDLLQAETSPEKAEEPELKLPTSGDAEAWKKLASILQEMPVVDKTELGKRASEFNISKDNLNEKLALGLEGRRTRKAWDTVLERFVECGFLVEKNGGYVLAAAEKAEKAEAPAQGPRERDPRLQEVYDRYVGAMARLWEETF